MSGLRQQNPLLIALAIVGVCALLYSAWTIYQRRSAEQQQRAIISEPAQIPGVAQSLKSKPKPPPQ